MSTTNTGAAVELVSCAVVLRRVDRITAENDNGGALWLRVERARAMAKPRRGTWKSASFTLRGGAFARL